MKGGNEMGRVKAILMTAVLLLAGPAHALEVGDRAPDFEAPSTGGTVRLSDYRGEKHVLLAFYFKDFTGG